MLVGAILAAALALVSCSGPDQFADPPLTPDARPSPTSVATEAGDAPAVPTEQDSATATESAEPTSTEEPPTPTPEPTAEPTPTEEPTPTPVPVSPMEALPRLEELPEGGYIVANQGDRTADQLAQAYTDSAAHLTRLEDWGFQQHVFREFTRNETGPDDTRPTYVLATVNVYGSPEQADMALQWLEDFQVNQGATTVEPPQVGDAAVAITVTTSQGEATASVYVRLESRIYIYYAQENEPLPEVVSLAERVLERLTGGGNVARSDWSEPRG